MDGDFAEPTAALSRSAPEARLLARVEELERALGARNKTIEVLTARVEGALANRSTAFTVFEQNITLEGIIAERTRELREQGMKLERALDDRKRMESRLIQAQKLEAIGSLAAGVAHEINTPVQYVSNNVTFLRRAFEQLTSVARAARAILDAPPGDPSAHLALEGAVGRARLDFLVREVPRALEQSTEGLDRIASIVGAMKEFSHPSKREKELVDLGHAIATTITVASSEWKYVATVDTRFDAGLPAVRALRDELNQAILNLIVNAAHAIGEATEGGNLGKGVIGVATRREEGFAVIEVSDTGTGIPERIRDRIFDPFFTTKPPGKGTGQGLAIVYNIVVERHGGRVDVTTEVGKGSTFAIRLPMDGAEHAAAHRVDP